MQIKKFLIGIFLGFSLIVPGVSVSTTTFVFDVYNDYIEVIKEFYKIKIIKKNFNLVLGLLVGMILTVLLISNLYEKHAFLLNGNFLGLISVCFFKEIKNAKINLKFDLKKLLLGFLLVLTINLILKVIHLNNINIFIVILAGILCSFSFIIPGISGGLILMALNLYYFFISAFVEILNFDFCNLYLILVFIFVLITFILINSRIIKIKRNSYFTIGLVLGSIYLMFNSHLLLMNDSIAYIKYIVGLISGYLMGRSLK